MSKIIRDIKYNRYLYNIYKHSKKITGKLSRAGFIIKNVFSSMLSHGLLLNDYKKAVKKNGFVYKMEGSGLKVYVPYCDRDCIQMTIIRDETYYGIDELNKLKKKYIKPNMKILDIGANIGNHSLYFARECKAGHIWQFEPQEDIFQILKRNMSINGLDKICDSYNVGLGASEGIAVIDHYSRDNTGGTSIKMSSAGGIKVCCLDDYTFPDIDFVKIDVEGFEYNVLTGGENTLRQHKPIIYIEIMEDKYEKVNRLLEQYGYRMVEAITSEDFLYMYQE